MKLLERARAISLRRQGSSIKGIAQELKVSQSTASRWCAGITLSTKQRDVLETRRRAAAAKALAPWIRKNHLLKEQDVKRQQVLGRRDVQHMSKRDLFILGLGLYWGEGYKRGSQEWGFTNSDPRMVRVILVWLSECYAIPVERVIARLTINVRYRDQAARITRDWTQETSIPLTQFSLPTFIQGYNGSVLAKRTYRGTLRIKVRRSTSLRRRILASIAEMEHQIAPSSRKTAW